MDIREVGKQRSQRIKLDYYRQATWLTRSRSLLALLAIIGAGAYGLYVFASGSPVHLSTGPLAMVHASFENDCQQCHFDFTPITTDAGRLRSPETLARNEAACQKCHRVDPHFRSKMNAEFASLDQQCGMCHTDHLGRDHDLVNVATNQCTQCHAALSSTCQSPGELQVRANVTAFTAQGHGDFASIVGAADPGRIKFDHAQHLRPGQVEADQKGGFTIAMLETAYRQRYRKTIEGQPQADTDLVTLSCLDCHQYAGELSSVAVGDNEIGRHMAPLSFEQHCSACHSLNHLRGSEDSLPLPHAAPWKEVETLIAAKVTGGQTLGDIRMPRDVVRERPLVGEGNSGSLQTQQSASLLAPDSSTELQAAVSAGRQAIEQRCLQCHEPADITDESIARFRQDDAPKLIPERWLQRGIYDHAAHRKMDCSLCHAQAYQSDSKSTESSGADDSEVVMIGGIETCVGCHRDVSSPAPGSLTSMASSELLGGQATWYSADCRTCHRYHWQRPEPGSQIAHRASSAP